MDAGESEGPAVVDGEKPTSTSGISDSGSGSAPI
jgi:hypothetical protein